MTDLKLSNDERVEICAAQAAIQKRCSPLSPEWQRASDIINRVWRPMRLSPATIATLSPEARAYLGERGVKSQ